MRSRTLPALGLLIFAVSTSRADVEFRRSGAAPDEVSKWFSALDGLLDDYDDALEKLTAGARSSGDTRAKNLAEALAAVSSMADRYAIVTEDAGGAAKVKASLNGKAAFEDAVSLKKGSLYRWAKAMRQEALDKDGPNARIKANALLSYRSGSEERRLAILDISDETPVAEGAVRSTALAALIEVLKRAPIPEGTYVAGGSRLWIRAFGARVYYDARARENDGLIRFRYEEKDGSIAGQSSFYFLTRALLDCGYAVSVQNGELTAVLSGKSNRLDAYDRAERLSAGLAAFRVSGALRPFVDEALAGSLSQGDNALRLDELARVFAAEGGLPFLEGEGPFSVRLEAYRSRNGDREALRADMSRTLLGLGLEPFPAEVAVGQRSIDLYFNAPLSAAVSRGELARKNGELIKTKPPSDQKKWLKSRAASEGLYGVSQVVGRVDADIIRRVEARDASGAWTETYVRTSEVSAAARYAFDARVLGGARPVSGVVTYDPGRVDSSSIFVTPYLRSGDAEILAKAAGVVTTDGGVDDVFASVLSGKTVLDLFGARWSDRSGLKLEAPIFGPPVSISGASLRRVSGRRHLFLREGDRVRLNTKSGSVEIID